MDDSDDENSERTSRKPSNVSNASIGASASDMGGNQSYAQLQQQLLQLEKDAEQVTDRDGRGRGGVGQELNAVIRRLANFTVTVPFSRCI